MIDQGELLSSGTPKEIIGKYQKLLYAPTHKQESIRGDIRGKLSQTANEDGSTVEVDEPEEYFDPGLIPTSTLEYESQGAIISDVQILTLEGEQVNCLRRGMEYRYVYKVNFQKSATLVRFGMLIKSGMGIELGGSASAPTAEQCISYVTSGVQFDVEFKFKCALNSGTYFLNAGVQGATDDDQIFLHRILDVCMFRVLPEIDQLATGMIDFCCYPTWSEATAHEDKVSV